MPAQQSRPLALLTVGAAVAAACGAGCSAGADRRAGAVWTLDTAAVLGPAGAARPDSARVNLYVDATVSMNGYVADPNGRYPQFLQGLESAAGTTFRRADVHFYRFGAQAREVGRPEFLTARGAGYYTERVTDIDQVIDCGGPNEVRVVVTDLFQNEGDVNAIVGRVKDRCFQKGRSVAVLGLTSQFNGRVYDAKVPTYAYASTADPSTYRPFYALLLGDGAALQPLLASLSARAPGGGNPPYVVVGPTVVRRYAVAMRKAPGSREFNAQAPTGPYEFNFTLLKGQRGGTVLADVAITPAAGALPLRADQLELVAYRRTAGAAAGKGAGKAPADSAEAADVTLQRSAQAGDTLHLTLGVNPPDAPGTYAYKLALRAAGTGGFGDAPWVTQYSSDNPTPTHDAGKTLNLATFVRDLRAAASSVAQPRVAVWYLTVRKL